MLQLNDFESKIE